MKMAGFKTGFTKYEENYVEFSFFVFFITGIDDKKSIISL